MEWRAQTSIAAVLMATIAMMAVGSGAPAGAHADLVSSCPGNGEAMSTVPRIRFTFDGPLIVTPDQPAFIRLIGPDGSDIPLGPVTLIGVNALVADVQGELERGEHDATYEVISEDGDPNFGSVTFDHDPSDGSATNCEGPLPDDGTDLAQILLVGGPIVVLGGALFGFNRWAARQRDAQARHSG